MSPSGHGCCAVNDPLLPESVANGPDEVREVVRTMVRAGADVIKTATTGGASSRPGHGPSTPRSLSRRCRPSWPNRTRSTGG